MSSGKRSGRKIVASLLGGANAAFLLVIGAWLGGDDILLGNLGEMLMLAGLVMGVLVWLAWLTPLGAAALLALGGALMLFGFAFTPQAGLLLGGAGLVAGLLFAFTTGRAYRSPRRAT